MAKFLDKDGLTYFYEQLKTKIPDGITVLTGTSTNPINANNIKEVGIYIIEGNRTNFPNDTTLKQVMQVSYSHTEPDVLPAINRLLQTVVLQEGIYTRTILEQYPIGSGGPSYTYTNWIIQNKEVGYEDDLQGTEIIEIEDSDFEGIDGVDESLNMVTGQEVATNEYLDGKRVYLKYITGTTILGSIQLLTGVGILLEDNIYIKRNDDYPQWHKTTYLMCNEDTNHANPVTQQGNIVSLYVKHSKYINTQFRGTLKYTKED